MGSLVQAHPEALERKSCKAKVYRAFLFDTFQSCTQIAPVFKQPPYSLHPPLCRISSKDSARDNLCRVLSNSRVDKLETSMGFQLSTVRLWRKNNIYVISSKNNSLHVFQEDIFIKTTIIKKDL
jgi:hypothetical protein